VARRVQAVPRGLHVSYWVAILSNANYDFCNQEIIYRKSVISFNIKTIPKHIIWKLLI
jgi:hypothetical protein